MKRQDFRILLLLMLIFAIPVFVLFAQFGKGDILFKVKKNIGNVIFSHKVHAGLQQITCEYCHNVLLTPYLKEAKEKGKRVDEVVDKLFCNSCHNGQKAFSTDNELTCKRCHSILEKNNKNGKGLSN